MLAGTCSARAAEGRDLNELPVVRFGVGQQPSYSLCWYASKIKGPGHPAPVVRCRTRPSSFAKNAQDFGYGLPLRSRPQTYRKSQRSGSTLRRAESPFLYSGERVRGGGLSKELDSLHGFQEGTA